MGGGQHQVCAVRLQQVDRTDIGMEPSVDQTHHGIEGFCRFAAFCDESMQLVNGE